MKNPNGTKLGKTGFDDSGGSTHIRYDHQRRPNLIHIKCPQCGGLALAKDQVSEGDEFVGDLSQSWYESSFKITCTECPYRNDGVSYDGLTEPFHQFKGRGDVLWAYNSTHLDMIYKYLKNVSVKGHPYEFYQTYIHGDWKKYKETYIKEIDKHLSKVRK